MPLHPKSGRPLRGNPSADLRGHGTKLDVVFSQELTTTGHLKLMQNSGIYKCRQISTRPRKTLLGFLQDDLVE